MNLTEASKEIASIRSMEPGEDRLWTGRTVADRVAPVLADPRVAESTAARLWIQLARYATGRVITPAGRAPYARDDAETAARAALAYDGDPLTPVRDSTRAVDRAETALREAKAAQAEAVRAARATGVTVKTLEDETGLAHQTVYDMINGS